MRQPTSLRPIQKLVGHEAVICALAWSPDGGTLASASRDRTIRLWNTDNWILQRKLVVHESWIKCIDWSPDSRVLASGSRDQRVKCWDTRDEPVDAYQHGDHVECVAWMPTGWILASGARDGTVTVWDLAQRQVLDRHVTNGVAVTSLCWSSDGRWLATASRDGVIRIWPARGKVPERVLSIGGKAFSVSWSGAADLLAVGCDDKDVRILSPVDNGRRDVLLEGHSDAVVVTRFSKDGKLLFTGSSDGASLVWDSATWKALASLKTSRSRSVHGGLACHPQAHLVACVGDRSTSVNIFDLSAVVARPRTPAKSANSQRTILFLAANPKGSDRLRLDREFKKIEQVLERASKRDQFRLIQKWAVTDDDLRRALLEHEPEIVHFSGHGGGGAGLVFENDVGGIHAISNQALAGLLELCAEQVKCVVLNACYSEIQATAIVQHIEFVIGMTQAIGDEAAIKFAVGFYDALGAGRSYDNAFKFGRSAIDLKGLNEHLTPVMRRKA
jgi:WD40 repeat protein